MDPVTQGVVGATVAQFSAKNKQLAVSGLLGFVAGMAADLDYLIRSNADPLLFLEFHRQFTHSLLFIPVGGLITAIVLQWLFGRRWGLSMRQAVLYCSLGYATHALLDSCTSYGTQLFWPMSGYRVSWNIMPVIDPLYTLPLLCLVIGAARKHSRVLASTALVWLLAYPTAGYLQQQRAFQLASSLAEERGHQPHSILLKPSFGNILLWKSIYEFQQHYYVDAVQVAVSGKVYDGENIEKFSLDRDMPWLDQHSQQAADIERFRWFSQGYIALDPNDPYRIIDVRYSHLPNQIKALWGIVLSPEAGVEQHADYKTNREMSKADRAQFTDMLFGRSL